MKILPLKSLQNSSLDNSWKFPLENNPLYGIIICSLVFMKSLLFYRAIFSLFCFLLWCSQNDFKPLKHINHCVLKAPCNTISISLWVCIYCSIQMSSLWLSYFKVSELSNVYFLPCILIFLLAYKRLHTMFICSGVWAKLVTKVNDHLYSWIWELKSPSVIGFEFICTLV